MKIRVTKEKGWYRNKLGEVFEVVGRNKYNSGWTVKVWNTDACEWDNTTHFISDGNYEVVGADVQPKVHEIDGKQYVEVDRKAEVGDKIVSLVTLIDIHEGGIYEVTFIGEDGDPHFIDDVGHGWHMNGIEQYRVLEPVEPTKSIVDILANLSQKIVELEKRIVELESDPYEIIFTSAQVESIIRMTSGGAND